MGGIESRFEMTNWDAADGRLQLVTDTMDGSEPAERYTTITLTKRPRIEYDAHDHEGNLLYTTKSVQQHRFYLLNKDGERILRVQGYDSYWKVFSLDKPSFPGQQPTRDVRSDVCYRKAKVKIDGSKSYCYRYGPAREGKEDVTGVVQYDDPLLRVEKIESGEKYQTCCSKTSDSPLVGYWEWEKEKSAGCKTVKLHLAKGTDIALHCVLVALIHIVQKGQTDENVDASIELMVELLLA